MNVRWEENVCDQEQCLPMVGPWTMIHPGKLAKHAYSLDFITAQYEWLRTMDQEVQLLIGDINPEPTLL